jgi:hypothetical protein
MKTSELPLHQPMDILSNDYMWVVMGSVEQAIEKVTGNFWFDSAYFQLELKVRTKILHLAPEE